MKEHYPKNKDKKKNYDKNKEQYCYRNLSERKKRKASMEEIVKEIFEKKKNKRKENTREIIIKT